MRSLILLTIFALLGCNPGVNKPPRKWDVSREEAREAQQNLSVDASSLGGGLKENLADFCANYGKIGLVTETFGFAVDAACADGKPTETIMKLAAAGPLSGNALEKVMAGDGKSLSSIPILPIEPLKDDSANKLTTGTVGSALQLQMSASDLFSLLERFTEKPEEAVKLMGEFKEPGKTEKRLGDVQSDEPGFIVGYEVEQTKVVEKPVKITSVFEYQKLFFELTEEKVYLAPEIYQKYIKGSLKDRTVFTILIDGGDGTSTIVTMAHLEIQNKGFHDAAAGKVKSGFRYGLRSIYALIKNAQNG